MTGDSKNVNSEKEIASIRKKYREYRICMTRNKKTKNTGCDYLASIAHGEDWRKLRMKILCAEENTKRFNKGMRKLLSLFALKSTQQQ